MKNLFIELTDTNDSKIFLNAMHIAWIEPGKNGTVIRSNMVNHSLNIKVQESYDKVKELIRSLDNS